MFGLCNNSLFCDIMIKKITGFLRILRKNYVQIAENVV